MNFNEEIKTYRPLLSIESVVDELEKNDDKDVLTFLKLILNEMQGNEE